MTSNFGTRDWIWDIETYPNAFTMNVRHALLPITYSCEISDRRNDSLAIKEFVFSAANRNERLVGFNSIGFDYPVLHMLLKMGKADAKTLYDKAMAIITAQDNDKWAHYVKPSEYFIQNIDLFKIHHFDNKAKSTSLKALEFTMRMESVEDLPFPVGTVLTNEQIDVLHQYNKHDVEATKKFYFISKDMIAFREELTAKYQRDFMNHNDTKIGKDFFIMKLEENGIACYDFGPDGRKPKQTRRSSIALKDVILPWITFSNPEFQRVLVWLKEQTIYETKGVFRDLTATVNGVTFVFGLGGLHASVDPTILKADDEWLILDIDVEAYYPSTAIAQSFKPSHYPEEFCNIYSSLKTMRKNYAKGTAENAMLKLALNGVYGDSNNEFSPFYDPAMTMAITLNGQLLLCLLVQNLTDSTSTTVIQANTDGLTLKVKRSELELVRTIIHEWEEITKLTMEHTEYSAMYIRDVNSYIAVTTTGKCKLKGAYVTAPEWHKDHSALVVQKVTEKVLLDGAPIRQTIEAWPDKLDFLLRVKVPRSCYLTGSKGEQMEQLPNLTRYYVAKDGVHLHKWMPPLKDKPDWRKIGVRSGWGVQVCNKLEDMGRSEIDYEYYVDEVEKLVFPLM